MSLTNLYNGTRPIFTIVHRGRFVICLVFAYHHHIARAVPQYHSPLPSDSIGLKKKGERQTWLT